MLKKLYIKVLSFLVKKLKQALGFFPQKLPVGFLEFDQFCNYIFKAYDLPDLPSYRHTLASMIMHLGPTTFYKAPRFFAVSVKKAMANQVAFEVIQRIREEEKKLNDVPTETSAPVNEPPLQQ